MDVRPLLMTYEFHIDDELFIISLGISLIATPKPGLTIGLRPALRARLNLSDRL